MSTNGTNFKWTAKKLAIAKGLSMGYKSTKVVSSENDISVRQIQRWKSHPDFMLKVDELTLAHDKATKAGLLREAYKGLNIKRCNIEEDKTTHLDYMKEIADLQAHKKQNIELSGSISHPIEYVPAKKIDDTKPTDATD